MKLRSTTKDSKGSKTDWKRVDALSDADIDLSETPEVTPEMFARGILRKGLKPIKRKQSVTLRLDADVLDWFRAKGPRYQTRINELLRAFMEASDSK